MFPETTSVGDLTFVRFQFHKCFFACVCKGGLDGLVQTYLNFNGRFLIQKY